MSKKILYVESSGVNFRAQEQAAYEAMRRVDAKIREKFPDAVWWGDEVQLPEGATVEDLRKIWEECL